MRTLAIALILFVSVFVCFATAQNTDQIYFDLGYVTTTPDDTKSFVSGYLICNRPKCVASEDFFTVVMNSNVTESRVNSKHIDLEFFLANGTQISDPVFNRVVNKGEEMTFKSKLLHDLVQDEVVYFTAQLEWYHANGLNADVSITLGYGNPTIGFSKFTQKQQFHKMSKPLTEYPSLRYYNSTTQEMDVTLYLKTPSDYEPTAFELHPYGAIYLSNDTQVECLVNNLQVDVTVKYDEKDTLKHYPYIYLTIPQKHAQRYQHWQKQSDLEINCDGGISAHRERWGGWFVVSENKIDPTNTQMVDLVMNKMQKSWKHQVDAMRVTDGTVIPDAIHAYEYKTQKADKHGELITYSYNSADFILLSAKHDFPTYKKYLYRLNNLHGGALVLIRWALNVQDEMGNWLPFTNTGKMSIDYYLDGNYAECKPFSPSLTKQMKQLYDPTKPALLTISFVLSFEHHPPSNVIPTSMLGVKQDVHFNSLRDRTNMAFFTFVTPSTQKKAFVVDSNFALNVEEEEEESTSDIHVPLWDKYNNQVPIKIMHSFNLDIQNVQYNDGERPSAFTIRIPTREYNFGGNTLNCSINNQFIDVVDDDFNEHKLTYVNDPSITFNFTLLPSTSYNLKCPYIFLTNSSSSHNANTHDNKNIIVQFLSTSPSEINEYFIVGGALAGFHHDDHDDGVKFSVVTLGFLTLCFVACVVYIWYKNYYNNGGNTTETEQQTSSSSDDQEMNTMSVNQQPHGQYSQFKDQERH